MDYLFMVMVSTSSPTLMWKLRKSRSWQRRPKSYLRRLLADKVRRKLSSFLLLSTLSFGPLVRVDDIRSSRRVSSRRDLQLNSSFSLSALTMAAVFFLFPCLFAYLESSRALTWSSSSIYCSSSSMDLVGSCGRRERGLPTLTRIGRFNRSWSPT